MAGESAEKKLYDAATIGDVATFQQLLQENPHLLDVVSFPCLRNVLHIAIKQGQESIMEEVLQINPRLARISDSQKSSPLHIAVEEGKVEITKRLLSVAPETCWWHDDQGMNPIHVAAMKGHEEVLKVMLQLDLFPAMERVHRGQTVLHLCVKHRQLSTLKVLVEKLGHLVNAQDDDGETILHFAVKSSQVEIVRYLVESNKMKLYTTNSMGKTALDILHESFRDTATYSEIRKILPSGARSILESMAKFTDMMMVVAVLIATMAFQAAVSPPGGVWQDDTPSHSAGRAVMASAHPKIYKHFVRANNTAFISSLLTIFLITVQGLFENSSIAYGLYGTWVSLTSISVSYGASLMMTNPMETLSIGHIAAIVVSVFFIVFVLVAGFNHCLELLERQQNNYLASLDESESRTRLSHPSKYLLKLLVRSDSVPSRDTSGTVQAA